MVFTLTIRVPIVPVAQPRVKVSARGGHAKAYNPTTIKNADGSKKPHPIVLFKAATRMAASAAYTGAPLECALRIDCCFVFPRPSNKIWKNKPMPRYPHISKPDRDNLDKAVLDSLKGIIVKDDCQACAGEVAKWVASGDEQPHVLISIAAIQPISAGVTNSKKESTHG